MRSVNVLCVAVCYICTSSNSFVSCPPVVCFPFVNIQTYEKHKTFLIISPEPLLSVGPEVTGEAT
jgi:hypothetical protein